MPGWSMAWRYRDFCGQGGDQLSYRDVHYTVAQGIGRQIWKWGFAAGGKAHTKG
jgi:hypothetical protein